MTPEEIKALVQEHVKIELQKAKEDLANKIKNRLLYTGQHVKCSDLMEAVNMWAKL